MAVSTTWWDVAGPAGFGRRGPGGPRCHARQGGSGHICLRVGGEPFRAVGRELWMEEQPRRVNVAEGETGMNGTMEADFARTYSRMPDHHCKPIPGDGDNTKGNSMIIGGPPTDFV